MIGQFLPLLCSIIFITEEDGGVCDQYYHVSLTKMTLDYRDQVLEWCLSAKL